MDASVVKKEVKFETNDNELMDTGEKDPGEEEEEGEIVSDDESDLGERDNVDDDLKRSERAKRFSLLDKQTSLAELYESLGIDSENERHYRLDAIHVRGTDNMTTEDVFKYFAAFSPQYVEWLSDTSCNVVWLDDVSAARAMVVMSRRIKAPDSSPSAEDDAVELSSIPVSLPPGKWRFGEPTLLSPSIILRFATKGDKKQGSKERLVENPNIIGLHTRSLRHRHRKHNPVLTLEEISDDEPMDPKKNPWGSLAESWGKSDDKVEVESALPRMFYPDLRNALGHGNKIARNDNYDSDEGLDFRNELEKPGRRKIPRMKMYADEIKKQDEQRKILTPVRSTDLRSRLAKAKSKPKPSSKPKPEEIIIKREMVSEESESSNSESSDSDDLESSEWALEGYEDLRKSLGKNKQKQQPGILEKARMKSRIEESSQESEEEEEYRSNFGRRSPLQIEIDNDKYFESESD